jgi:2-methylcitrate dehydratase
MDAAKWNPMNRETADHSLPYLLAVGLVDGYVDQDSCGSRRLADPALRPLMRRIRVVERPEFTARFPAEFNVQITVTTTDGRVVVRHAPFPYGHPRNPASDGDLLAKFDRLVADRDHAICDEVRVEAGRLSEARDLAALMGPLRRLVPAKSETSDG